MSYYTTPPVTFYKGPETPRSPSIETTIDDLSANQQLASVLDEIGSYYDMDRDQRFRARAFKNAAKAIANYPFVILSGVQARNEITGIGSSIEETIDEYYLTGHVKRLDDLKAQFAEYQPVLKLFESFYGIGPVSAMKFYNLGYRTLEDLWGSGRLTEAQKTGIIWRDHLSVRIPRSEMGVINSKIGTLLNPSRIKWEITGSYRRGEESSSDVDLLVQAQGNVNMAKVLQLLSPIIVATLASGESKFMGIMRLGDNYYGHRIDIRIVPAESYVAALMYFTGSQSFNVLMRQRAITLGMTLNEYELYQNNTPIPVNSEEDIFKALKVRYLTPVQRTKNLTVLLTY